MSCRTSLAPSQLLRCPPQPRTWRGKMGIVRAWRCRLHREPDPYQWVGSNISKTALVHRITFISHVLNLLVFVHFSFFVGERVWHTYFESKKVLFDAKCSRFILTHSTLSSFWYFGTCCLMQVCLKMRTTQMCRTS